MKGLSALLLVAVVAAAAANQCPSEQEENWEIELLLRHEDCDKFYKCAFGQPVVHSCPPGLYFNLELWQCDWQHKVDCTDRNIPGLEPKPEEEAAPEPEPEEVIPESEESVAPESEESVAPEPEETPVVVPEPEETPIVVPEPEEDCSPEAEETPIVVPEPEEVAPEPEVPEPEQPEPEQPEPEQPEPEQPEPEQPEIEFQENGCPVNPHVHWLLPHEDDCNLFYYCVWGEKVQRQCPSSLHFNRDLQVCDWPWDAGCATSVNKHFGARRNF